MTYRKYQDSTDEKQQLTNTIQDQQVSNMVVSIQESLQQIDRDQRLVTQNCANLKRVQQPSELDKIKKQNQQILDALRQQKLPNINKQTQQLGQLISSSTILSPEQKTQYKQTVQKFSTQLQQKEQQILRIGQTYNQIINQIDQKLGEQDNQGYNLKAFQQMMIQEDIDAQLDDIVAINRQVNEINQTMQVMADEVEKCQETLNVIDNEVNKADKYVEEGLNNIVQTSKVQKSKNKWLWIGLGIAVVVIIIIVVIVAT